jgi:hypothetical protein
VGFADDSVALVFLGLLALRRAVLFAQYAQFALNYPYNLNYGEGPLLDQAVRLAQGEACTTSMCRRLPSQPSTVVHAGTSAAGECVWSVICLWAGDFAASIVQQPCFLLTSGR